MHRKIENRAIKVNQRLEATPGVTTVAQLSVFSEIDHQALPINRPTQEHLWTHRGALIEKSLALSHPSITCIQNPSVPTSSLTSNLICCLYFPQRQLPFLRRAQMSLSPTLLLRAVLSQQQKRRPCSLNLQLKPAREACTSQCNLWLIMSPRLLSPVSTVIVRGIQKLRPSEACSPLPDVDKVSIIPGVSLSAGGVISQGKKDEDLQIKLL